MITETKIAETNAKTKVQRRTTTEILMREAHTAFRAAVARAYPDRKLLNATSVVLFENEPTPLLLVAADRGMGGPEVVKILSIAVKTLENQESRDSVVDKEEEVLP